ncbi:MAG: RHS repeat-associated core domain-containing protein [Fimbriimonadaceae bacterium]
MRNGTTSISRSGVTTNTFTYNGLDTRVGKVDSGGTKTYKRDGAYVTDTVLSDGAANYTPGISERRSGATLYSLDDRLGSFTRQTDSNQATSGTRSYDAFGLPTGTTGSPTGPFGFAGGWGYQEDGDYGFKLLGHRYYDPATARFLTKDRAKSGRNWYSYVGSNPGRRVDPSGLIEMGFGAELLFGATDIGGSINVGYDPDSGMLWVAVEVNAGEGAGGGVSIGYGAGHYQDPTKYGFYSGERDTLYTPVASVTIAPDGGGLSTGSLGLGGYHEGYGGYRTGIYIGRPPSVNGLIDAADGATNGEFRKLLPPNTGQGWIRALYPNPLTRPVIPGLQ